MKAKRVSLALVCVLGFISVVLAVPGFAAEVPLTILHTNDVHSHYHPDKGPFGLGGIARLATTIRRARASAENSILLDGGDWSEGHIYYNLEPGRTSIEMMNALGYDAAVIGNHDWLSGPDQLLKVFGQVGPTFPILGANLDFSAYKRHGELTSYIKPYQIVRAGPLKIAVIGLATYELIYDKFFLPVKVKEPFSVARRLAEQGKKEADLVVVISHNGMATNKLIAGLPNVDVVIHAHDHVKLPQPVVVERSGKSAILVETHHWGFYLGRLDLVVDTETKKYTVKKYELIQQDDTIPDDPAIAAMVRHYDREVENKYGDVFHDHLAESKIDIRRDGNEALYGNLLTDAYREFTGADVSFEQMGLTSSELRKGWINSADIFNALSAIYDHTTGKAWTLRTMRMTGETLQWMMNFILTLSSVVSEGLSVSGMHAVYDPLVSTTVDINDKSPQKSPLASIEIGGKPLDRRREYLVALPGGIWEAVEFIEKTLGNKIPKRDLRDTGVEDWRVAATYLKKHSPIDSGTISRGGRLTVLQSDLGMYHDEIQLTREASRIEAVVTVRNMGSSASSDRTLTVTYDRTPKLVSDDPNPEALSNTFAVEPIAAGKQRKVSVSLTLPDGFADAKVPVYFRLDRAKDDTNKSNDGTWLMVYPDGRYRITHPKGSVPMAAHGHQH